MAVSLGGTPHVQASSSGQQLEVVEARGHAALLALVPNPGGSGCAKGGTPEGGCGGLERFGT